MCDIRISAQAVTAFQNNLQVRNKACEDYMAKLNENKTKLSEQDKIKLNRSFEQKLKLDQWERVRSALKAHDRDTQVTLITLITLYYSLKYKNSDNHVIILITLITTLITLCYSSHAIDSYDNPDNPDHPSGE